MGLAWFAGFIVGIGLCGFVFAWQLDADETECRKQHDVFKCEMTWLPAAQQD